MNEHGASLFETAIGRCGIVWTERGIAALRLPSATDEETESELRRLAPNARFSKTSRTWPPSVRQAVTDIAALLAGEARDLRGIELDFEGVPPFHRRVYEAARELGCGQTCSYGEIATRLGSPGSARAVGQALGRNPFAVIVPCHRVLAAGGKMGGFTATGGVDTKRRMLQIEATNAPTDALFDGKGGFPFDTAAAVRALSAADPKLARLIERVGPFALRLNEASSVFHALAEAIVYQQLHGKAAATIFGRVCALFPAGLEPQALLSVSDERLRGAGLSRSKLLALRDLAQRVSAGELPSLDEAHALTDAELIERLTAVRGVGRWTVQMLLMFRLGRPDVLPVDDFGIQKGFALTFGGKAPPTRDLIARRGERWKPFRSVASWYLWRAVDLAKSAKA